MYFKDVFWPHSFSQFEPCWLHVSRGSLRSEGGVQRRTLGQSGSRLVSISSSEPIFSLWGGQRDRGLSGDVSRHPHSFSHSLTHSLQHFLPDLTVVERVTPAHLHRSHDQVLLEDVWAQRPVEILTLLQRDLQDAQHEAQDRTWGDKHWSNHR